MKMVLVFAGNFREYLYWKPKIGAPSRYVSSPEDVLRFSKAPFAKVGRWWINENYDIERWIAEGRLGKEITIESRSVE